MKFVQVPKGHLEKTPTKIRNGIIGEFKEPKSESHYITELREIKQFPRKSMWDFDQRLKILMAKVSFEMSYVQHKEWFIASLVPHICMPLMQQKITSQAEAQEIALNLEASLVVPK